jgi:hypothetical protein
MLAIFRRSSYVLRYPITGTKMSSDERKQSSVDIGKMRKPYNSAKTKFDIEGKFTFKLTCVV